MSGYSLTDSMTVTVPEGVHGDVAVERFTVEADAIENIRLSFSGRGCRPGTYTRMTRKGRLWMSDTSAEKRDHSIIAGVCARPETRRVLVNGLGLGMIVQSALQNPAVEHIDVVEIDPDVIALVGPHYEASGRVTIHQADAYEQCRAWPKGTTWDAAWHDIWPDLCVDNLEEMAKLHRSYGRRVGWQGSWGKGLLESERERDRRNPWGAW